MSKNGFNSVAHITDYEQANALTDSFNKTTQSIDYASAEFTLKIEGVNLV